MSALVIFIVFLFYILFLGGIKKYHCNISLTLLISFMLFPFLLLVAHINSPDTSGYKEFLELADYNILNMHGTEFASGFQMLTKIIKFIVGNSYPLYIFFLSLINSLFIIKIIKLISQNLSYSDQCTEKQFDYVLALLMYFVYFGLYYNSITIRANYALTIIYLITAMYINRKITLRIILLTILMFLIANSFHVTAIVGILALIIFYLSRQYSKTTYIITWFLLGCLYFSGLSKSFVLCFLDSNTLNKLLNIVNSEGLSEIIRYSTFVNIENTISFKFIFQYLLALLLIFPKKSTKFYYQYLNVYFVGIVIGALWGSMQTITRIQDFFTFSLFILSWLYIREIKMIWNTILYCIIIIIPQLIFVLRIINNY